MKTSDLDMDQGSKKSCRSLDWENQFNPVRITDMNILGTDPTYLYKCRLVFNGLPVFKYPISQGRQFDIVVPGIFNLAKPTFLPILHGGSHLVFFL